jgi:hypothetical protein
MLGIKHNEYRVKVKKIIYYFLAILIILIASNGNQPLTAQPKEMVLNNHMKYKQKIDLREAIIVTLSTGKIVTNAAKMLRDEISSRTGIGLKIQNKNYKSADAVIIIGTIQNAAANSISLPQDLEAPKKDDGYSIWINESKEAGFQIYLIGYDERGALFAVGKLLRELRMERNKILLDNSLKLATSPRYSLRGHQLGYRAKTNSYDAWTIDMWEQYFRDLIVFGMNAVELVPPKTDDHYNSPLFPLPPMEMMIKMSQLADDYGLDVWIWYPGVEKDFLDPLTMDYAMRERDKVLSQLPRVDAVFVPSGDPSEIHPDLLFPLMKNMKEILNRYHTDATIWSSLQNYDDKPKTMGWTNAFLEKLNSGEVDWFDGIVFGPATEISIQEMREKVPEKFPIRRYPDITHSRNSQYEVPDWDEAYKMTEAREIINPRPKAYTKIFRDLQQYSFGFISYSEGCNDDVNKIVWSSLGWDPDTPVEGILEEYARYFIGPEYEETFSNGLLKLEENWEGPVKNNSGIYKTLDIFKDMETDASPNNKLNWRFQQALYRAYYDAYVKARLDYETDLENKAITILKDAKSIGAFVAVKRAEEILAMASTLIKPEWRARIFELGEALFQSIRMQLSVPKYYAKQVGRGANLDLIDVPLNNSAQLLEMFNQIKQTNSETDRLELISKITSGGYEKKQYKWEKIKEAEFRKNDEEWFVQYSAEDMEHGPAVREKFANDKGKYPGLIGFRKNELDFEDPSTIDTLIGVNQTWNDAEGEWVGYWNGYVEAPISGEVFFQAEVDDGLRLDINEETIINGLGRGEERIGRMKMEKGKIYPIRIWYFQNGKDSFLKLYWCWVEKEKQIIDSNYLFYGPENLSHIKNYMD